MLSDFTLMRSLVLSPRLSKMASIYTVPFIVILMIFLWLAWLPALVCLLMVSACSSTVHFVPIYTSQRSRWSLFGQIHGSTLFRRIFGYNFNVTPLPFCQARSTMPPVDLFFPFVNLTDILFYIK